MTGARRSVVSLATIAMMAAACASGTRTGNGTNRMIDDSDRTTIRVTNNNWSDMVIYLERNGVRQRLGTVTSQSTQIFVVPNHVIETSSRLQLLADPIGSSRLFASPPLMMHAGQTAMWQLENSLALSSIWIR